MKKITPLLIIFLFACTEKSLLPENLKEVTNEQVREIDGIIYEKGNKAPFTGRIVKYHSNGNLQFKVTFVDGKENGPYVSYYNTGELRLKTNFKNGKEDGLQQFYLHGKIKRKTQYKNGKKDGLHQTFLHGKLKEESQFKSGKLHGVTNRYKLSGALKDQVCYIKGETKPMDFCDK